MMEDPELRKLIDKAELEFYKDTDGKARRLSNSRRNYFSRSRSASTTRILRKKGATFSIRMTLMRSSFRTCSRSSRISITSWSRRCRKAKERATRQQYCDAQAERIHNISQLLKAYCLYEKDVEYVVEDKVIIVDTFTGRKMPGRRWSDGLHQAVEAKEGVQIDRETQTSATITIQNYFRLYEKLAGMTGTAETEANEFHDIYRLDVNVIPTNRPVRRLDENDRIYKTRREKYTAVIDAIKRCAQQGSAGARWHSQCGIE